MSLLALQNGFNLLFQVQNHLNSDDSLPKPQPFSDVSFIVKIEILRGVNYKRMNK